MTSSSPVPKSDLDVPISTGRNSLRSPSFIDEDNDSPGNCSMRLSDALAAEREEIRVSLSMELEEDPPEAIDDGETLRMSLMDLLEETDRKEGMVGPNYRFDEEELEEEEVVVEEKKGKGAELACCCVCRVKYKGKPLVPCGHVYCNMCSREMWVQKGHCPVCSSFVLEILHIF